MSLSFPLILFAAYPTITFLRSPLLRARYGRKQHAWLKWVGLVGSIMLFLLWTASYYSFEYSLKQLRFELSGGSFAILGPMDPVPAGVQCTSWATWVRIPLWIPFFALAIPTTLLWRRPLPSAQHCESCGYDLTGNMSGICPECGEPTPGSPRSDSR
jgi:hypothetical protein